MTEAIESRPLKRKIPPDLQREVEEIQNKVPRIIDPSDDLDDNKKRWLVVGICLHAIISPVLRNYVLPVVTKLCYILVRLYNIEQQTYGNYLKTYAPTNTELNYEAINSNKANHKRKRALYDYRVRSAVDLSRLFLQTHMAHFTAFDDSCDSSALLGIIINIDRFPAVVQSDAQMIRSDIRNSWAHCDFTEWTTTKYVNSFQLMRKLISNLRLSNRDENRIMGEINRWELNGQNFLSLTKFGLEIVGEIRQQTNILSRYVQTLCTETDSQFNIVKTELTGLECGLQEMTERIENLESRTRVHEVKLRNLEMQKQVEDPIPKNILEQIKGQLEDWKKKDKKFVSTRASDYVMESIQGNNCVTLTAPAGVGKSFICRHTALILQKKGYNIIPVYAPTDIRDYYQPGKQTVFIVDDICGNYTINQQQIDNWTQLLPVIVRVITDKCCKIIVCCRLQVYKDDRFQILTPFKSCECNLVSDELCLTSDEKTNIAKSYIITNVKDINDLSQDCDFFPLLCSLYLETKNADMKEFFKNPFVVYRNELDRLNEHGSGGNYKLCSLALCVLFNNDLKEKWFQGKMTDEQRHVIEHICEAFGINRSTSKTKLKKALETLDGTFICKQNGIYRTVHDKLFDFLAHYFGQKMMEYLLDYVDSDLLHERFIWQKSSDDMTSNIEFMNKIPDDYLESYLERLIKDWSAEKVAVVFSNNNMKLSSFRQNLIQYLLQLDKSQQVTLANTKDTASPKKSCTSGNTPLIDTCYYGYTDMFQWLHNDVSVNQCRDDGATGLNMACQEGHIDIVKLLLDKDPNVDACNNNGMSPLLFTSHKGHTDIVKLLLEKNPNVDLCNNDGWSPLNSASDEGHTDIVKLLLEKNPNVDLCNNDGWSPLNSASDEGHTDIVKLLLEKNPNVDLCNNDGWSPLNSASDEGHTAIVKLLLEKNPNVDLCNKDGWSPLNLASNKGHTDIVKLLLERNINIDLCNNNGWSPLNSASAEGHTDIVKLLLEKNPNVDLCSNDGWSPLNSASDEGHTDIVKLLLEKNPNVDLCNNDGWSPLLLTSHKGHTDIVKLLLEKNPNVDLCNKDSWSPLNLASNKGHTDIVKLLLEKNPNVDLCNKNGWSPLNSASAEGHTDIVKLLLEKIHNVDLCNKNGWSPLNSASDEGHTDIVKLLLEKNPNVDLCNKDGWSPLLLTSHKGHTAIVKLLLEKNPNVDLCNNDGWSPLNAASDEGHTDIVKLLLEKNPNVDLCNNDGLSPLNSASDEGHTDIVKLLLERNPNVDLCDNDGWSPLLLTSHKGHTDIVKLLLEKNPNVDLCNKDGWSPLNLASNKGHTDIVKLLLERNINIDLCNNNCVTPLISSCSNYHTSIVLLLIQHKADINAQTYDGGNALYFSARNGNIEITQILLENNADCNICVHCKQTVTETVNNNPSETLDEYKQSLFDNLVQDTSSLATNYVSTKSVDYAFDLMTGSSPLHIACFMGRVDVVKCLLHYNADINMKKDDGTSPLFYACEVGHGDIVCLLLEKGADTQICRLDGKSPLNIATDNGHTSIVKVLINHN